VIRSRGGREVRTPRPHGGRVGVRARNDSALYPGDGTGAHARLPMRDAPACWRSVSVDRLDSDTDRARYPLQLRRSMWPATATTRDKGGRCGRRDSEHTRTRISGVHGNGGSFSERFLSRTRWFSCASIGFSWPIAGFALDIRIYIACRSMMLIAHRPHPSRWCAWGVGRLEVNGCRIRARGAGLMT
jgi:hypothetical protein